MTHLSRRARLGGMLGLAACAVLVTAYFNRSAPTGKHPRIIARSGTVGVASPRNLATPQPGVAAPQVLGRADGAIAVEIDGVERPAIDSAELAGRATNLQARDRRAWRLTDLIDSTYIRPRTVIHALTIDGGDYILNDDGRQSGDAIVVRRNTGELYLGWLDGGSGAERPLADAERPAERIERVARIRIASPAAHPEPPASLTVIVDGKPHQTVTPQSFERAATLQIRGQREGAARAIDVAALGAASGSSLQVVSLVAGGQRVAPAPPSRDARAVIYLTRRARFKFAWIDGRGEPLDGTKRRDVSEIVLATDAQVAARP